MSKFESLEDWIDKKWGTQGALAEKLGMAQNTISSWVSGRSRIKPPIQGKLKSLGYDGPFPEGNKEITQDDLQALGRDLVRMLNQAEGRLSLENQALGAVLQQILLRVERISKIVEGAQ